MKKIFMAIALCLVCACNVFGEITQYKKVDSVLSNYTGEFILVNELVDGVCQIYDNNKRVFDTYDKLNDSIIECNDSLSFQLVGTSLYTISQKYTSNGLKNTPISNTYEMSETSVYVKPGAKNGTFVFSGYSVPSNYRYYYLYYSSPNNLRGVVSSSEISNFSNYLGISLYKKVKTPIDYTVYIHDTTYVHDTTTIEKIVNDTIYLPQYITVHDTTIEHLLAHDTTYITEYVEIHDTVINIVTDTVYETIYLESNGTCLTYPLENYGITYFYGQVLNMNGIQIYLYSSDGKLVEKSKTNISMANKNRDFYIVTDGKGGYLKFNY